MNRSLKILLSIPRTVWFNLRYFPLPVAAKLPVWIAPNVHVRNMWRGGIRIDKPSRGRVRFGFHEADGIDIYGNRSVIDIHKGGVWQVDGDAHIGHGAIVCINPSGVFSTGRNFAVSGTTSFICNRRIKIGDNVQFSWESHVMDSNAHVVYAEYGSAIEPEGEIRIGNRVWVGAKCTLLKGTVIGDDSVVAACSMVNKDLSQPRSLIGGIPARLLRPISGWKI